MRGTVESLELLLLVLLLVLGEKELVEEMESTDFNSKTVLTLELRFELKEFKVLIFEFEFEF